ncbi:MAG: imidazoleglycerol-phosphate dehydratase HisB [Gemmatimonadetes bacterium]|nr:imidazoleglycerol-phosphate dehydratase HisB [Gemmatimonadota bacterium]
MRRQGQKGQKGQRGQRGQQTSRTASVKRVTAETEIALRLDVDGHGATRITTPIPFFSHMLDAFCRFGNFDLRLEASGDVQIDQHHTVEDVGLALGQALREALGERRGIRRAGSAFVPMDDALGFCAVDLSGRPYCAFDARFDKRHQGDLELDLVPEFFRALANASRGNWHLKIEYGENEHHKVEALFKSAGRALGMAVERDPARGRTVPSTKGMLE